ncbi:cobalt-precorrin-5B (C(1))-methyltransferase [Reinekea marinisedimentorum]|uniref:Cobalt-precorrin-5B C(1)-methyltransferase n=1 Tax=Reinekea marinisedimentorum TaxID=230495 RepID=A0A4R3I0I7_9GAMM|nr:cobalt-precorrin-5B (C(1))-methyltransferase [Reinekea marinisedimentorum]TCS39042.1 cobalt-precorrin-5B (C1)-methyltransferase [Reinekea marinisedimentorum]
MGQLKRSAKRTDLRSGYTTGACAAAAARAAVYALLTGHAISKIGITLPNKAQASFQLARLDIHQTGVLAGVIKDAGDDPDCTHGLEIQCFAAWQEQQGFKLTGGEGVATVTLPGLELPVGEPAINPVPRQNILAMADEEWRSHPAHLRQASGVRLTIGVPGGEEAAKQTINERLGLLGGISILGTRGTVKPYSTSAFASSVRQSVQVAATNGLAEVVLTTGSRSEKAAMNLYPHIPAIGLIQAGDFIGIGLRSAKRYRLQRVALVVMIGKLSKLVSGRMMTHVSGYAIDFGQLSAIAEECHLPVKIVDQIAQANTGRYVLDCVRDQPQGDQFLNRLCYEAWQHAKQYINNALYVEVTLIDFNGDQLASSGDVSTPNSRGHDE